MLPLLRYLGLLFIERLKIVLSFTGITSVIEFEVLLLFSAAQVLQNLLRGMYESVSACSCSQVAKRRIPPEFCVCVSMFVRVCHVGKVPPDVKVEFHTWSCS